MTALLCVVVVRQGALPSGAHEAAAEANGNVIVIGTNASEAASQLTVQLTARSVTVIETEPHLRSVAATLAANESVRSAHGIILPASPDGRDLAPLLAHALHRSLYAAALSVTETSIVCVRTSGRIGRHYQPTEPFLATLVPGVRGTGSLEAFAQTEVSTQTGIVLTRSGATRTVAVLPPDPATMDLAEAPCIIGGGLGLGSKERFDQLGRIGSIIGASLGGTRVASDAGWIPFERQIGTTGVAVKPSVYLAFAISGATQHTSGLGDPDHIISVNLDPSCPMMTMANVAIVSDANLVLDVLEEKLRGSKPVR